MFDFIKTKEEQARYAMLYQISDSSKEIYTDNENYYMTRSDEEHPVWIWTKKGLSKNKLIEIKDNLEKFLIENQNINFTCSDELYEMLKLDNYQKLNDDYFEMGTYLCKNTINPNKVNGNFRLAKKEDIETLAKFHKDERLEIEKLSITIEQSINDIENIFDNNNKKFYVWENNKKIVCMAVINKNNQFARINYVYTPKEERCKSYAKNLIYQLTQIVLKEKFLPILYTDSNYPASNKAYMDVGYKSCGILINFSCSNK